MKNKFTAAVLAFFLGGIGVHRFYLGQAGSGIAYLLFCWTSIPFFIAFIDFLAFLLMSEQSFDRKYNYQFTSKGGNVQTTTVVNNIHTAPPATSHPPSNQPNHMDALERLYDLKQKGVLSEEEFAFEKAKILGNSTGGSGSTGSGDPFMGR